MQTPFGSSAGGEQPKFLVRREDGTAVLVKFSPPHGTAVAERIADLLVCEYLALELLAEEGLAAAGNRLLQCDGRRFLEVPRFDRVGRLGRRNVVMLFSLAASATGIVAGGWPDAVAALVGMGIVSEADLAQVELLHAFGELIGNSDMHFGDLAFFFDESIPFRLTPAYDMLPMLWMPSAQGKMPDRKLAAVPPLPSRRSAWLQALDLALEYWRRVAEADQISVGFEK